MKKAFSFFLASLFILFTFSSCKNFMSGGDILEQLEDTIDFLSAPYVNVVITADNQATQSISPAVGSYTEKYKNTSKVPLSFEETENYQFTNWVVEPSEAVAFDDETAKSTVGVIQTEEEQVTIFPKVYKRPEISISPSNLIVSPKNISTVITFDHKMEISEEQIASIDIQLEGISILNTFKTPVLSENNGVTTITFTPDRAKLVNVETASAKVDVIIPEGFSYKSDTGFDISTNKQTVYSYKISNETLDKAKINFSTSAAEGELSFSENQTYSLDQEVSSTFTPTAEYLITGWKIVYENGDEVDPSVVQKTVSTDNFTITIKLITGSERQITVKPICEKRKAVTFTFASSQGTLSMSGEKKFYSGDVFSINYTESSDYAFTGWSVYSNGATMPSTNIAQILSFDDSSKKDVKITIKEIKQDYNLQLIAENLPRPTVDISPKNVVTVAKNTAISIDFMRKMEISEKQLESIDIQISNLSIKDNFNAPEIEEIDSKTVITFIPKRTNLITLEAATATVNVIIPEGFYYLSPTGQKIATIEKTVYAYKINNETLDKATISVASTQGTLSYSGTKDYFLDDEFTISFTPSQEYEITGWGAYYADNTNTPVSPNTLTLTTAPNDITTVTAKLISGSDKLITLKPICKDCNYIQASFIAEHGYVSPTESKKIYSGKSLSLSFRQDTAFAFLNWQILNAVDNSPVTPEQFASLFELDTSALETELKVKELSQNYSFKFVANCAERAQILSTTPLYSADGTYRDTRIQVMFDHDMSEDSIYYSVNEREKIKSETHITDADFLYSGDNEENYKYYGYKINDEIVYKNISVINYKTNKNILENFDAPYFESNTILVIPTNNIKPPAAGTQVFVTIDSDFFYEQNSVPIKLASSKKWNYLVNSRIDTNPPELTVVSFKRTKVDGSKVAIDTSMIQSDEPTDSFDNDATKQETAFTQADKLELAVKMEDLGSGPDSIKMNIFNVSTGTRFESIRLPIEIYGTEGFFGQYSDSDLIGISLNLYDYINDESDINGTISINFTATDLKGNPKNSNYYVIYSDTTAPEFPTSPELETDGSNINIYWQNPSDTDFEKVIIEYNEKDSSDVTKIENLLKTDDCTCLELEYGKTYEISMYPIDIWGNIGPTFTQTKNTIPGAPVITTQLQDSQVANSVTISWNKPEGNYTKALVLCTKVVGSSGTTFKSYETESADITSHTFTDLTYGNMYVFRIYAFDSENQKSASSSSVSTFVLPEPVTSLRVEPQSTSQIKLIWTNPSSTSTESSYTGYRIYYKPKSRETWDGPCAVGPSYTSGNISGLNMGTEYDFIIKRYSQFRTNMIFESTEVTASGATKAGSVNNLKTDSISTTSIDLSWENLAAENYDSLLVEYKASSDTSYTSIPLTKGTEEYTAENLKAGTTYTFNIYAVYSGNKGTASELICDTKPNSVTNLQNDTSYTKTTSSIRVKWSYPTSGKINGTKIYYSTSNTTPDENTPYVVISKGYSYATITGLTAGTNYYITAVSLSEAQEQESAITSIQLATKTATVTNLTTSQTVNGNYRNISLSWSEPSGNYTNYTVYYGTSNPPTLTKTVAKGTNTCSLTSLTAGQRYYIYVRTNNTTTSEPADTGITTFITTPNKVTNLTSKPSSTTKIELTWTNPSYGNKTGVRIYRKTGSGSYSKITDVTSGETTYEDTLLTAGTAYTYKVVPYITYDSTTKENTDTVTTSNAPNPNKVTNLKATTTSTKSQAYVSWTYPTSGSYTGAIVYYRLSTTETWTKYSTVSKSYAYSYVPNLTPGEKYYFKVVTYANSDTTNISGDVTSSVLALYPNPVTNLSASESVNSVTLNWTKPSGYIYSYNIYKKTVSGSYTLVTDCSISSTKCTITGLNSGTKYTFKVTTLGRNGSATAEATVTRYTKPAAPTNISVYCDDGQGRIKLKWTQPSGDAFDDVDVYVGTTKVGTVSTSSATAGSTAYLYFDIPNFSRSSYYTFNLKPYIIQADGTYGLGDTATYSNYRNSSGNLKINGTTYSYTCLENVITSSAEIKGNTTLTDGAFTKNRNITLSPYSIGAYEVTNDLYYAVTGKCPSGKSKDKDGNFYSYYPVENMNWYQACWFCNKLSNIMGFTPVYKLPDGTDISTISYSGVPVDTNSTWSQMTYNMSATGYRLPTEAEWEFAARGGSISAADWNYDYAGSNTRNNVAWCNTNANETTHAVGGKTANRLGLYDMSGNVWEWLTDWNNNVPSGTFTDPVIPYSSSYKSQNEVLQKGGAWNKDTECMVDYNSTHETPGTEDDRTGFRIMRRKTCN